MTSFRYGANVNANGIRQHYLRFGNAVARQDPVIILPGITSPAITWGFVGERFGTRFDTYILDIRGRGLSESSASLDYGIDALAEDLLRLVSALELTRCAVVGHSMGARIAARAVHKQPKQFSRVVLVDPPVSGPGRRAYPSQLPWYIDSINRAKEGCDLEVMRSFCPTWTDEQLRLRSEWLHTCDERAVRTSFLGFHADDFHADLSRMDVPSRLIVAGRGDVIREEDIEEISALVPGIEVARVPDAGHMIPWDDEEGFYEAFGVFLGAKLTTREIQSKETADVSK